MKFVFIAEEKAHWPVEMLCDVLSVSRSGYYAWQGRGASPREVEDAALVEEIKVAYAVGRGAYGSPRVQRELRKRGRRVGKKRVERLMRREGVRAVRRRKFRVTTDSKHKDPIALNILNREFRVELPNTAWVTDVTYVWTHQGWLYLAAILDLCSRRVVGWATSASNDRQLALDALEHAVAHRKPLAGMLHHSDRGSPYASGDYREALIKLGVVASMSRKGDCWDNAVAESFFATIKGEMIDHEDFQTRAEATAAIADYIDGFYNVQRMHSS
ncbi:MAG: IS3 family transposase, partial [Pseudonocardiaceae bacterium]